ncbi:hypothetical protein SAMN05216223_10487 [Actinacidiphila yanglinensis]|uniref:Uncharacterized protein n=1 Tax=Actinacidiphila yanglinensis TaxID=310779 RepID=A0A1H5YPR7_9ACTN|nr:hypothetical protein [Actinacidiphila yanglinensis]SEG26103.1 hypothetical protein SAMN05216223_10487 [Actinacidiphila yanglinensis]
MRRPSRRGLIAAVAGLVAVCVVAVVVAVVVHSRPGDGDAGGGTPPPLGAHAADIQRLRVVPDGNPSRPTGYARRADGTSVALGVQNTGSKPTPQRAILMIRDDRDTSAPAKVQVVRPGQTVTALGVRVRVLRIWQMSDPDHNAIDIQVDPVAS